MSTGATVVTAEEGAGVTVWLGVSVSVGVGDLVNVGVTVGVNVGVAVRVGVTVAGIRVGVFAAGKLLKTSPDAYGEVRMLKFIVRVLKFVAAAF